MTGDAPEPDLRPAVEAVAIGRSLASARRACDRAADDLAQALALDHLPAVVRHALASALRRVAEAQGVVEVNEEEGR
ncbi:MAG: hypothetical protein KIT58_04440 [Planctomycetota bacterium]|nr:hypothetical protein [Planctomycetota bacterium]